jgi:outer membrane protein assembly factor BamB
MNIVSSPTVENGVVYIGDNGGRLFAVDACSGRKIWEKNIGGMVGCSPAVVDGRIFLNAGGFLYSLDAADGTLLWKHLLDTSHYPLELSSPAVAGGIVYAGSHDRNITALDAVTGTQLWRSKTRGWVEGSPAVADGIVYRGDSDHWIYALNASTGERVWSYDTGMYPYGQAIRSSPAIADGVVYVGSDDHTLYAFDASTGSLKWKYEAGLEIADAPAVVNGTVYFASDDGYVYAVE